ncbi:TROVE domain-containing protein [Paenibacillus sp. FSL R5-0486]|uniref:TROVE domain-containing protein n=1 Tax=Paenibacillus sp. FSL R5-0486 TaxID=2921645 RepID=UPI0030D6E420
MSRAKQLFNQPQPTTRNHGGYGAYERLVEEQYIQMLMTNTLNNTFYADTQQLMDDAMVSHQEMAEVDAGFMARALVYARNEGLMRLQPLYGLALLSKVDPDQFAKVFSKVVQTPADLADFLTILRGTGRGQGGRAVKRQVSQFLNGITEYWAIKYNGRGRGYSLGDMIATAHPKPIDLKQKALFRYLRGHEVDLTELPQLQALEKLKATPNPASRMHLIEKGKLPYSVVTSIMQPTRTVWEALMSQMPTFALLRHLNAMDRAGVFDKSKNIDYVTRRLTDAEALRKSRILPFRFASAYEMIAREELRDALRQAVELSIGNLPTLPGRTAIFLDRSGSMQGDYLRIGSVLALALYKQTRGNALFWLFDHMVEDARPKMDESILSQAHRIRAQGGTDTGRPVRELRDIGEKVDQIIMITDEQQNEGSPLYAELERYRRMMNPELKAFIVDIAPYQQAMVPPRDGKTFYIYGWSETVLTYIAETVAGYDTLANRVREIEI